MVFQENELHVIRFLPIIRIRDVLGKEHFRKSFLESGRSDAGDTTAHMIQSRRQNLRKDYISPQTRRKALVRKTNDRFAETTGKRPR